MHHYHHRAPLVVAGILFTLIALLHIWRIATGAEVIINASLVPMWVSVVALIVSALMAIWMFVTARCCCCHGSCNTNVPPKNNMR